MESKAKIFYPSINVFIQSIIILFMFALGSHLLHIRNPERIIIMLIVFDVYQWFVLRVKISNTKIEGPNAVCLLRVSIERSNVQIEQAHVADRKLKGVYRIYDKNTNRAIHLNIRYLKLDDVKEITRVLNLSLSNQL